MGNLYEVLEKSNKDLTTEQFSIYIHNILENSKGILSEEEINSLLNGSKKLFKILIEEETKSNGKLEYVTIPVLTNHNPECIITKISIDTYDFLQEHKEIQVATYTSKQLEKMANIDKKFRQLGEYKIAQNLLHTSFYIDFDNVITKEGETDHDIYSPFYPSPDIYTSYIKTFEQLKNAKVIIKGNGYWKDTNKLKWDGENFVPYEESKINIDEAEKIVQDDIKETCQKSYKESMKKHAVSGYGTQVTADQIVRDNMIQQFQSDMDYYAIHGTSKHFPEKSKVEVKAESIKMPEDTANEVKKTIDQYFKDLGIDFTNLQHQTEKAVKQEIENYNKDMALSKTMGDSFLEDIINEKSSNFRKQLKEIISNNLDDYGKILTYKISLPALGCSNMEEVKSRVENLNNFKKQLNQNVFYKIPEKEFIELYNKAFDGNAETIFDIVCYQDIKL